MLRQSRLEAGFASSTTVSGRAIFPGKSYCWLGQKLVPLAKCTALFRSQTQHLQSSARLLQGSGLHCRRSGFFGDARLRFWDKSGGHPGGTHLSDRRQRSPSYAPSSRYWRASGFRRFRSRVSMHREAESDQDISVEIDSASGDNAGNNHVGQHAPEQEASANSMASWLQFVQKRRFPERLRIVVLCFLAFLINNIDRINLSVAILPMRHEFGWSSTTVGIIQSAFFWGYPGALSSAQSHLQRHVHGKCDRAAALPAVDAKPWLAECLLRVRGTRICLVFFVGTLYQWIITEGK